ncbi:hypothetical protein [Lederbergia galactosidilytica]|nr:hypothetical protein [Lederbergia galactosidilytica]
MSSLLNININELETLSKFGGEDLGWESVKLPTNTNLRETQNLKLEKQ